MPALSVPAVWRQAKVVAPKPVLCSSSSLAQRMFYLCCFWGCLMAILASWRRLELCNRKAGSSQAFWGLWNSWIDSKRWEMEMPGEECTVGTLETWGRWKYVAGGGGRKQWNRELVWLKSHRQCKRMNKYRKNCSPDSLKSLIKSDRMYLFCGLLF